MPTQEEHTIGFNAKVQNSRADTNEELKTLKENGFKVWGGYDKNNVFAGIFQTFLLNHCWIKRNAYFCEVNSQSR